MTTPKANFAGLALMAAPWAGLTLGLTAPAWAGFDEGVAAAKRGDFATAKAAKQGDAKAQYELGFMYGVGVGVSQDYAEAAR